MYLNDLPEYIESIVHLFADDTVLYLTINTQDNYLQLQTIIWITLRCEKNKWLMSINPEKCEIIQVYQKRTPFLFNYTLQGVPLKTVPNTKYLGLLYPKMWNGTPIIISKVTAKGYRTLGFLKQRPEGKFTFSESQDIRINTTQPSWNTVILFGTLVKVWKTMVPTIWQWCSDGLPDGRWGDMYMYQQLESVSKMLKEVNWRTSEKRRVNARLTRLYKISKNVVAANSGDNLHSPTHTSSCVHDYSFIPISTSITSHRPSFYPKTIVQWNSLPACRCLNSLCWSFSVLGQWVTHQQSEWFWRHCFAIELLTTL